MVQTLTCAETAKLVRRALAAEFPGVTFTVRSKTYAGGASISVGWTDGPTEALVARVAKRFEGADFDPMIDLKSYRVGELDGAAVHFGADFVFCSRRYSREFAEHVARLVARRWGCPVAAFHGNNMTAESAAIRVENAGSEYLSTLWDREARELARSRDGQYVRVALRHAA